MYSENDWRYYQDDYLAHHGIAGQKWGVRQGPPYPLAPSKHSAAENKAGWRRSINTKPLMGAASSNADDHKLTKAEIDYMRKNSENYSDKSEARKFIANMALDAVMLNPIGLVQDAKRLAEYSSSASKTAKFEKERVNSPVDPKTGFRKKTRQMTSKEDLARVNPSVHNFDANSKSNCMLCTTAYDMRKRGYDVTAKTAGAGFSTDTIKTWYPKAKINVVSGDRGTGPSSKGIMGDKRAAKQATDQFMADVVKQGEGARGNICITWAGTFGGHSMAYEVSGGQVRILDGQINKIYNNPHQILDKTTGVLEYARLDNVDFDPEAIKRCCR